LFIYEKKTSALSLSSNMDFRDVFGVDSWVHLQLARQCARRLWFALNLGNKYLSTFVGPVDNWSVNILNLLVDLLFWLGIMAAVVIVLLYKLQN